jgi:5-methylcytosine-specific restriction protein A
LEEEVWKTFASDHVRLRQVAKAIRENVGELGSAVPPADSDFGDEAEAEEGKILTRVHKMRERNSKIVRDKKKSVFEETGKLACEACGFDFKAVYGDRGEKFGECHHEVPVSELVPGQKTKLSDLRIVCANCHRMIHRFKPWKSVYEIADLMSNS